MPSASNTKATKTDKKRVSKKASAAAKAKRPARKVVAKKAAGVKPRSTKPALPSKPDKLVGGPVILDAKLGIENVAGLIDQLAPVLSAEGAITIEVTKVESIDTAALQVLVAFANSARAQSRALEWRGSAGTLIESSELADLDRYLEVGTAPAEQENDGLCPVF